MRLFLLPISTRRTLIYCERSSKLPTERKALLDKATTKAAQIWVQWEKSNKKWQRTVTEYGNRAFQRIPFEEWGLKSIPPLSPQRRAEGATGKKVEVIFPPTLIKPDSIGALLRKLGTERQSLHRKRMWWSIVGMPITLPMALIPVIPNIPFFYLCFRAWSHWRALSGSKHLQFILDNNITKPSPSSTLDELYSAGMPKNSEKGQRIHRGLAVENMPNRINGGGDDDGGLRPHEQGNEVMLLQQWHARLIAQTLEVPELHPELERALRQVKRSLIAGAALNGDRGEADATEAKEKCSKQ